MKKVIDSVIVILIVLTIAILTAMVTYAWFSTSNTKDLKDAAKAGTLEINYTKGQDITDGILIPSANKNVSINTSVKISKSDTSIDALAGLTLEEISLSEILEQKAQYLYWEVYENNSATPLRTGNFASITDGKITILSDYELSNQETTLTVYIWLDGYNTGNEVKNQTFSAKLKANAINKPATVS